MKELYYFLKYGAAPAGLAAAALGTLVPSPWNLFAILPGLILLAAGAYVFGNTVLSRNRSNINPVLEIEHYGVTDNNIHNAFTSLARFNGSLYMAYTESAMHLGNEKCSIKICRSNDGRDWTLVKEINSPGEDIRDPKLAAIDGRLCLYVLLNTAMQPQPYKTMFCSSADGEKWSSLEDIDGCDGWLFWTPVTNDGRTWYCPAYWHGFHKVALFKSVNGRDWSYVTLICERPSVNECALEFTPDGDLAALARMEYSKAAHHLLFGHPEGGSLFLKASAPYTEFSLQWKDNRVRLDGPQLFRSLGQLYGIGRKQDGLGGPLRRLGSVFTRKRTAIYRLLEEGPEWVSDLPSSGDTSYPGVDVADGRALISYYTNDIRRDCHWIFGMIEPAQVRMAVLDEENLRKAKG